MIEDPGFVTVDNSVLNCVGHGVGFKNRERLRDPLRRGLGVGSRGGRQRASFREGLVARTVGAGGRGLVEPIDFRLDLVSRLQEQDGGLCLLRFRLEFIKSFHDLDIFETSRLHFAAGFDQRRLRERRFLGDLRIIPSERQGLKQAERTHEEAIRGGLPHLRDGLVFNQFGDGEKLILPEFGAQHEFVLFKRGDL